MESVEEIVDGYEYIVNEGRIPSDLTEMVKTLSIAGKSSQPGPRPSSSVGGDVVFAQNQASESRAFVAAPQDRICVDVEEEAVVGEVGSGVEVASDDDDARLAVQFVDDVLQILGVTGLKVPMFSQGLASNQFSSPASPTNAAACGKKVVPLASNDDEVVVTSVRKSPLADALEHAAADLSRKRKGKEKMTGDFVGEPMKPTDLGLSIEKNVPELSIAMGNSSGKCGAAALDNASLSDTRGKEEEGSSMPVHVARGARKPRGSRRTRGARISSETDDENRGTKGAAKNNASDENLGVSEGGKKKSTVEEISKSKGVPPPGEKISEHADRFNDPSSRKEGNSGQGSTPVSLPLTFLQAVEILTSQINRRRTDRGIGDESILTEARRAGYTFPSYSSAYTSAYSSATGK